MKPISLDFRPLTAEDATWAVPLLRRSGNNGCEFSYTTMYMWRKLYHTRLARVGEFVFFSVGEGENRSFLPPVGGSLESGLSLLRAYTDTLAIPLCLHGVDENTLAALREICGDALHVTECPEDDDYVYRTADLASLPGRNYHSKKNHIAAFSRRFSWTYEELGDENVKAVLAMLDQWCREKGDCRDGGLHHEHCALRELLYDHDRFSLIGGLIRVEGEVAAFTVGSPINDRVFDIHVEKALSAYPGAYAVINQEFAKRLGDYELLNRENDLGIEGLRRAKRSYHPFTMVKKYACEIR